MRATDASDRCERPMRAMRATDASDRCERPMRATDAGESPPAIRSWAAPSRSRGRSRTCPAAGRRCRGRTDPRHPTPARTTGTGACTRPRAGWAASTRQSPSAPTAHRWNKREIKRVRERTPFFLGGGWHWELLNGVWDSQWKGNKHKRFGQGGDVPWQLGAWWWRSRRRGSSAGEPCRSPACPVREAAGTRVSRKRTMQSCTGQRTRSQPERQR